MKNAKFIVIAVLLSVFCMTNVSASIINNYDDPIDIPYGSTVIDMDHIRYFSAGYNYFRMEVQYLLSSTGALNNVTVSKVRTTYIESSGTYSTLIGYQDASVSTSAPVFAIRWGYLSSGNRYYSYSTEINGTDYYGIRPLHMYKRSNSGDSFWG
ncbi:MAG: hypothetical protein IJ565_02495 [Bacilli bacterium]|nr:hypothetical protein [Bacilli bacterium]